LKTHGRNFYLVTIFSYVLQYDICRTILYSVVKINHSLRCEKVNIYYEREYSH